MILALKDLLLGTSGLALQDLLLAPADLHPALPQDSLLHRLHDPGGPCNHPPGDLQPSLNLAHDVPDPSLPLHDVLDDHAHRDPDDGFPPGPSLVMVPFPPCPSVPVTDTGTMFGKRRPSHIPPPQPAHLCAADLVKPGRPAYTTAAAMFEGQTSCSKLIGQSQPHELMFTKTFSERIIPSVHLKRSTPSESTTTCLVPSSMSFLPICRIAARNAWSKTFLTLDTF